VDLFKFAFETLIVGLLALPWLLILTDLISPGSFTRGKGNGAALLSNVPDSLRQSVGIFLLLAVIYVVGSAVSPLAKDVLGDDDLPIIGRKLPTERGIQHEVYCEHWDWLPGATKWLPMEKSYLTGTTCRGSDETAEVFRAQETAVLMEGEAQSQRTRQLHEQIVVLQGTAFSALLCAMLCLFGWSAVRWPRSVRSGIAPIAVLAFAVLSLYQQIKRSHYRLQFDDPRLMELVLFLAGFAGLWTRYHSPKPRKFGRWALVSLLLGLIAYTGWWWAEVTYDEHLIHSFAALTGGKHPTAKGL